MEEIKKLGLFMGVEVLGNTAAEQSFHHYEQEVKRQNELITKLEMALFDKDYKSKLSWIERLIWFHE